jgi:hypothetical protein
VSVVFEGEGGAAVKMSRRSRPRFKKPGCRNSAADYGKRFREFGDSLRGAE